MDEIDDFTDSYIIYISAQVETRAPHTYITARNNFTDGSIQVFCERDESGAYSGSFMASDILGDNYASFDIFVEDDPEINRRINVWNGGDITLP